MAPATNQHRHNLPPTGQRPLADAGRWGRRLLILDGLSANSGHEGFDLARIRDAYRLWGRVVEQEPYRNALQIVAVDNELAGGILLEFADRVVLPLTQANRLIRIPETNAGDEADY